MSKETIRLDSDFIMTEKMIDLENKDKKEDAQRNMAWVSLFGMVMYPLIIILSEIMGLTQSAKVLGDMAGAYFVSVAAIVAAFYGKEAYMSRKD